MRRNSVLRILIFSIFLWVIYLFTDFNLDREYEEEVHLSEQLDKAMDELKNLHIDNEKLKQQLVISSRKREKMFEKKNSDAYALKGPREMYELVRRRISTNTKEIWYYVSSELRSLSRIVADVGHVAHVKSTVDEHYRSLLRDVAKLADVDGHSAWRRRENRYLSVLVEKRLHRSQNPPDCGKARKLLCNFVNNHWCGYGCRLHHFVKCLIVAYGTGRSMVIDNPENWEFTSGGWDTLFLPPSTCALTTGEPVSRWPGRQDVQVVNLTMPEDAEPRLRPRFIPVVLPEDLARRINVLHGDPAVWWIGQFFKYLLRPQPSTSDVFDAYANRVRFQKPIVGVHIRRTDKVNRESALHELEEYMYHVEDYYKIKRLDGGVDKKRIYLATDEPTLFDEAKRKYPEYEIIGDPSVSESGKISTREMDHAILNINIDIHFLSLCDYLVCTFSSNVCRLAYELMNSLQPDASAQFKSLDDTFYFSGQIRRLNVAIIPHKPKSPLEMDLRIGDKIEVAGNHWDGYSKGTNLRTKKTLLYPTFKVTPKIEVEPFTSYPDITVNTDELEDGNE